MRYLRLAEVVELHRRLLEATGNTSGIRDLGALESAIAQPKATFAGVDLYPTMVEKAAALCFSLGPKPCLRRRQQARRPCRNGNVSRSERCGESTPPVGDQERVMLDLAAGRIDRSQLANWLRQHLKPLA